MDAERRRLVLAYHLAVTGEERAFSWHSARPLTARDLVRELRDILWSLWRVLPMRWKTPPAFPWRRIP